MVCFSEYYLCVFLTICLHVLSFGYNVRNFHYAITNERKIQTGQITQTVSARSSLECSTLCGTSPTCSSGSYHVTSHTCFHSTLTSAEMTANTDIDSDWSSFSEVDWLLVFRAPAGIGGDVYISYVNGTDVTTSDPDCTNLTSTTCSTNYRHPVVDLWNSANFKKVKVSLYKNQVEDAYIVFNGSGSTLASWFAKEYILESSWTNATTDEYFYFSMEWIVLGRRFYICLIENGCPGDRMYMVAITQQLAVGSCPYDIQPTYPQFIYANTASPGQPGSGIARSRIRCSALCGASAICYSGSYDVTSRTCFISTLTSEGMTNYIDIASGYSSFSQSEWLLVFRAPAGIGGDIYHSYVDGTNVTTSDSDCTNLASTTCSTNYRHPIVDLWNSATFEKVKVALYKDQEEDAYIVFNGIGSTVTSWFRKERILESSWVNATTDNYVFFSIESYARERRFYICLGHGGCPSDRQYMVALTGPIRRPCSYDLHTTYPQFVKLRKKYARERRFYICLNHGGCPSDRHYMVALTGPIRRPCSYDLHTTYPQFVYANTSGPSIPEAGIGTALADFMAIFVK